MADIISKCTGCKSSNERTIQCEVCSADYCMGCAQLPKKQFKLLKKCASAHWYCPSCEPNAVKSIKADHAVEERCKALLARIAKMEGELKTRVTRDEVKDLIAEHFTGKQTESGTLKSNMHEDVSTTIENHSTEQEMKETRKLNIIIHNIPEGPITDSESQEEKETDKEYLTGLASVLEIPDAEISKSVRLGKVPENQSNPRPMKISFSSGKSKKVFMSKLGKLAFAPDKFKKVSVCHDMTQEEREQNRKLVVEAKNLNGQESTGKWIHRVIGLPGQRKIVRMEKKAQLAPTLETPTKEIQMAPTPETPTQETQH